MDYPATHVLLAVQNVTTSPSKTYRGGVDVVEPVSESAARHHTILWSVASRDLDLGARPFPGHSSISRHLHSRPTHALFVTAWGYSCNAGSETKLGAACEKVSG